MVLSIGKATAFATGPGAERNKVDADEGRIFDDFGRSNLSSNGYGRNYTDANGDGISNNVGNACAYMNADGGSICGNCG